MLMPFPLREVRWIWAKVRRRIETPLHYRRVRAADGRSSQLGPVAIAPALPWAEQAAPPGDESRLPWRTSWLPPDQALATQTREHRLQILSAAKHDVNSGAARLDAAALEMARELPAASVAAYRPIDWHRDFHSGHLWDARQFYLDVRVAPRPGADIKTPRELSRFQHVGALASGPLQQGAVEFLLQVIDWIAANPPRRGVNWACTMDVALRVVNWIWGLRLFEPLLQQFPEALRYVAASIREHGRHIENNLEYYEESTGNHYLSDIAGLLYVGAAFPAFPESDRWLLFALQELISEMKREVYADGGAHEASTHYHRLVAELFVSCAALAERIPPARRRRLQNVVRSAHRVRPRLRPAASSGLNLEGDGALLPGTFYAGLARMAEFTAKLTKPNGRVPQFGDNDSARAHKLMPWLGDDASDHAHLIATVGELLGRGDLRDIGSRAQPEALLVAGGLEAPAALAPADPVLRARDVLLAQSGIAVERRGPAWLAVTCGPNGQGGRGGHGHNDKLSFELNVYGLDFIVDGGCPAYSGAPELRNRFRSTWAHSTVAVTGMEQDPLPAGRGGLFQLPERCKPRLQIERDGTIVGAHVGYGVAHRRRFVLSDSALRIEDTLDMPAERWLLFNLDPAVRVSDLTSVAGTAHCTLVHEAGAQITLRVSGVGEAAVGEGCFGRGYGLAVPARNLRVRMLQATTNTEIEWKC
jgi:Heparinase II/III-like protein/Heparinase II/III N-terminus